MKNLFLLSLIFICTTNYILHAQEFVNPRYNKAVFNDITVTTGIEFAQADAYDLLGFDSPEPLYLDFYEPTGDTSTKRPLVITVFGGAFLAGSRDAADMVAWCDSLAHRGYVCASIDYRLGFNVTYDASAVRTGYRAVQDARAAIRFMKEYHDVFGIDTTQIFMLGNSAGAITAIQASYLEESDRPAVTYGIPGSWAESNDLGCIDCSGNSYQHTIDVKAVVGFWGAVLDTNGIDSSDEAPILMIHGDNDNVVLIDNGLPFGLPTFPQMYGSRTIHNIRTQLNLESTLHVFPGEGHNFYSDGGFPGVYWDTLFNMGIEFLCMNNTYCDTSLLRPTIVPAQLDIANPMTGVETMENANQNAWILYPNPSSSYINLDFKVPPTTSTQVSIYNAQGQQIRLYTNIDQFNVWDISDLPNGIYYVHTQSEYYQQSKKLTILK